MKKLNLLLLLIAASCSWLDTYPSSPEGVCRTLIKKLSQEDIRSLDEYVTEPSKAMLTMVEPFFRQITPEQRLEMQRGLAAIKTVECQIDGDRASCRFCCTQEGTPINEAVNLRKEKGRWLLHFAKETQQTDPTPPVDEVTTD